MAEQTLKTAEECWTYLNVSRTTFYELVNNGTLPKPIKLGRCARWRADELEAALEQSRQPEPHRVRIRRRAA